MMYRNITVALPKFLHWYQCFMLDSHSLSAPLLTSRLSMFISTPALLPISSRLSHAVGLSDSLVVPALLLVQE